MVCFDRESIIPGNFGFAISVCRLRKKGCTSKSVYVRVFNDLELLRYIFFSVQSNNSFNFPLGWIKYIVIVTFWASFDIIFRITSVYEDHFFFFYNKYLLLMLGCITIHILTW